MFTNNRTLKGFKIWATDGEIGTVDSIYFDDETWTIRYLTVQTGGWLDGRQVLISPMSIRNTAWQDKRIDVSLTKEQVEKSPSIDTHKPVSRQHEASYLGYYGYPYYWDASNMWGSVDSVSGLSTPLLPSAQEMAERAKQQSADSHLRSADAVTGYHIEAKDGEIGHVDRFIVDNKAWTIRYIEVATANWWPGKKVLLSPDWVERVSWEESKVYVAVTREAMKSCAEYDDTEPITRELENKLYFHYGRAPYWIDQARAEAASVGRR